MAAIEDLWHVTDAATNRKIKSKRHGQGKRYRVRYRTPDGKQKAASFDKMVDARRYVTTIDASIQTGSYIDPNRSRVTVGPWAEQWLEGQADLSPTTRHRYDGIIRTHLVPRWGTVPLASVSHADVQRWVTSLHLAPASVRKVHRVLSMVLDWAVTDGRIARNPALKISLPRVPHHEKRFLTHQQVAALAEACGPSYRLVVLFLAYTGLRWGELAALKVGRVDFLRHRITVAESVTPVKGVMTFGDTKGHERREVPLPRALVDQLARHVRGKSPSDLVFVGDRGAVLRAQTFQRAALNSAAEQLGLASDTGRKSPDGTPVYADHFHPHELRHTAASLAIASGADVKVVQQMLGHKSATMTLDQYGHLFPDRLDVVAEAMESARVAALAGVATVRQLPAVSA